MWIEIAAYLSPKSLFNDFNPYGAILVDRIFRFNARLETLQSCLWLSRTRYKISVNSSTKLKTIKSGRELSVKYCC